jgi:hypothetical protein
MRDPIKCGDRVHHRLFSCFVHGTVSPSYDSLLTEMVCVVWDGGVIGWYYRENLEIIDRHRVDWKRQGF